MKIIVSFTLATLLSLVSFAASKNIRGDASGHDLFPLERKLESLCQDNVACQQLGLEGECCPTAGGLMLDCCAPRECALVPACAALSLSEGPMCCPTDDGVFLACCTEEVPEQEVGPACSAKPQCQSLGLEGDCCPVSLISLFAAGA